MIWSVDVSRPRARYRGRDGLPEHRDAHRLHAVRRQERGKLVQRSAVGFLDLRDGRHHGRVAEIDERFVGRRKVAWSLLRRSTVHRIRQCNGGPRPLPAQHVALVAQHRVRRGDGGAAQLELGPRVPVRSAAPTPTEPDRRAPTAGSRRRAHGTPDGTPSVPRCRARPRDHEPATARSVHASSCSPACPFWPFISKPIVSQTGRHEHPDHLPCHRRSPLSSTATCRRNGRDRRFTSNNSGLQHLWRESSTTAPPRPQRSGAPRRIRPDRGPSSPATAHWTARARTVRPRIRRTPGAISWRRERDRNGRGTGRSA